MDQPDVEELFDDLEARLDRMELHVLEAQETWARLGELMAVMGRTVERMECLATRLEQRWPSAAG